VAESAFHLILDHMRPREHFLHCIAALAALIMSACGCQESGQIDCQIVGHSMATAFKSGLPGETVDFNKGNLLINGKIAYGPKPLWYEVSSRVFDSKPSSSRSNITPIFERLVPRAKEAWAISGTTIAHRSMQATHGAGVDAEFDFLDYRHVRCYQSSEDSNGPAAIDDANPFNQSIRRSPHPVDELDVRLEATFAHKGSLQVDRQTSKGTISAKVELRDDQTIGLQLMRLVNYDDLIHLFVEGIDYLGAIRLPSTENPEQLEVDASKPVVSQAAARNGEARLLRRGRQPSRIGGQSAFRSSSRHHWCGATSRWQVAG